VRSALSVFCLTPTATAELYALSLHDALPISPHITSTPEASTSHSVRRPDPGGLGTVWWGGVPRRSRLRESVTFPGLRSRRRCKWSRHVLPSNPVARSWTAPGAGGEGPPVIRGHDRVRRSRREPGVFRHQVP